jgi:hypothetical protein
MVLLSQRDPLNVDASSLLMILEYQLPDLHVTHHPSHIVLATARNNYPLPPRVVGTDVAISGSWNVVGLERESETRGPPYQTVFIHSLFSLLPIIDQRSTLMRPENNLD